MKESENSCIVFVRMLQRFKPLLGLGLLGLLFLTAWASLACPGHAAVRPVDRVAPNAYWGYPSYSYSRSTLTYSLQFSEPVRSSAAGASMSKIINLGSAKGCTFNLSSYNERTWILRVTGCSSGTLRPQMKANSASDLAGNLGPILDVSSAAPVAATQGGVFAVDCEPTVRKPNDPIVMPGMPGMSHLHEFFGPTQINDQATASGLAQRTGQPTSCSVPQDQSVYWMPVFKYNGKFSDYRNQPLQVYYRLGAGAQSIPRGLVMIAGSAMRSGLNTDVRSASWSCQPSSNYYQSRVPDCSRSKGNYDSLLAEINFPSCWDGVHLDSPDHQSHLAYPNSDETCDSKHPVLIAKVVMFRSYSQDSSRMLLPSLVGLASGNPATLHADFIGAWERRVFDSLLEKCSGKDCGHLTGNVNVTPAAQKAAVSSSIYKVRNNDHPAGQFHWSPAKIILHPGSTVQWQWSSSSEDPHNVISSGGEWYSGLAKRRGQWSRRFSRKGNFTYYCGVHQAMRGTILVR